MEAGRRQRIVKWSRDPMRKKKPSSKKTSRANKTAQLRRQKGVLSLFGKIEYEEDYDYKRSRRSKRL